MTIEAGSAAVTAAAGAQLAARLRRGDVVLISGDLGAGKTTFVRGACVALGVTRSVTSPSFTIAQIHQGELAGEPVEIAHVDLYRLETMDGEEPGFLDDLITPDRIVFIEWPDVASMRVDATVRVSIEHAGGDDRLIEIESSD